MKKGEGLTVHPLSVRNVIVYLDLHLFLQVTTIGKDVINIGNNGLCVCCVWLCCVRSLWAITGQLGYACCNLVN